MGKRHSPASEEDSIQTSDTIDSPGAHKKHKKHKKKHKKQRHQSSEDTQSEVSTDPNKPAIKLKIKIGGQTLGTKSVSKTALVDAPLSKKEKISTAWEGDDDEPAFVTKKADDDTSDEEREWLDALEKGELDDAGDVKKSKDTSLLTARQRALLHGKQNSDHLLELPSVCKSQELTEEQLQRRQQRAKKRKQQAHEKKEKAKKQILDRLLKKQDTKQKGGKTNKITKKTDTPRVRYINNQYTSVISFPTGVYYPYTAQQPREPLPPPTLCGVDGCKNRKKYNCSTTKIPLCSLDCYKKNLLISGKA